MILKQFVKNCNKKIYHSYIFLFSFLIITSNVNLYADYFSEPEKTPLHCDFIANVYINDKEAEEGDEIAFYDPQGIICGKYIIQNEGETGIIHVYGDNYETIINDEGAQENDFLSIRLYDLSEQKLYSETELTLSSGYARPDSSFIASVIPPMWHNQKGYVLIINTKSHFKKPVMTPYICNYIGTLLINGEKASIGNEISVYNANEKLCGLKRVSQDGKYGVIQIYGDNPETKDFDEGAKEGGLISFKIFNQKQNIEIQSDSIKMTSGLQTGFFEPSQIPPVWSQDKGYVLDLSADYEYQSIVLTTNSTEQIAGKNFILYAKYNVSDNNQLNGIGLKILFNSKKLQFINVSDVLQNGLMSNSIELLHDNNDYDNSELTDSFVQFVWDQQNWPGIDFPALLSCIQFKVKQTASSGFTFINSSFDSNNADYYKSNINTSINIINSTATIQGNLVYTKTNQDNIFVGAWLYEDAFNWKKNQPVKITTCVDSSFILKLTPGQYMVAAFKDIDLESSSFYCDIDDNEPYGFFTNSNNKEDQNNGPLKIVLEPDDVKTINISLYDWPYITKSKAERHNFPENFSSAFPKGQVMFAEIAGNLSSNNAAIESVYITGPGIESMSELYDNGMLPDIVKNDSIYSGWIKTGNILASASYTVNVMGNGLITKKQIEIYSSPVDFPQFISPESVTTKNIKFEWIQNNMAHDEYGLYILKKQEPKTIDDYKLITKINGTKYETTSTELGLLDSISYYYYLTTMDKDQKNVSYSVLKKLTIDEIIPFVINASFNPSGPVRAGNVDITVTFNEAVNHDYKPEIVLGETKKTFIGDFLNYNSWKGQIIIEPEDNGTYKLKISNIMDIAGNLMKENTDYSIIVDTQPPIVEKIELIPKSPVKEGNQIFNIFFNENMNTNVQPQVTFGVISNKITGNFVNAKLWKGVYRIERGYDGQHSIKIQGASDIVGNLMLTNMNNSFVIDTLPPIAPSNLQGIQTIDYKINLSWDQNIENDISGYNIYRNGLKINDAPLNDLKYVDSVKSNTSYQYNCTAIDLSGNESLFSKNFSITTKTIAPIITEPASGTTFRDEYINIKGTSEPLSVIIIFVNGEYKNKTVTSSKGIFTFEGIKLLEGGNVLNAFVEISVGLSSPPSDPVSIVYLPKPMPPDEISIIPGDTIITIKWKKSNDKSIKGYNIYMENKKINNNLISDLMYVDKFLTNGKLYNYQISSVDVYDIEGKSGKTVSAAPVAGPEWQKQ